jgi:hypothetical protein
VSRYMPLSLMTIRPPMIKPQAYETEVIDKLFLELSQVTRATTGKELRLTERLAEVSVRAEKAEQELATAQHENARLREALGARLFIDCEWNDYLGDLISMALVGEDGREWYEVLECRDPSSWVAENVMPKLGKQPTTMEHMRKSLCEFLSVYKAVTIIADWPEDIERFCRFLVIGPGLRLDTPDLRFHVWRGLEGESAKPHNALEDARANARTALGGEE